VLAVGREQHGGHGLGIGHVVDPVAEVDAAAPLRLAGVVHDQQVPGLGRDAGHVGLEFALDIGDHQAVAVAHPVGDGGQDDALGLARALRAKDSHASGNVLAAEAEPGTQGLSFHSPEPALQRPAPGVGPTPAAEGSDAAQMGAAQGLGLRRILLQQPPRALAGIRLKGCVVDAVEQIG